MGHRLTCNLPPLAKAWRVHIPQASQTRADPRPRDERRKRPPSRVSGDGQSRHHVKALQAKQVEYLEQFLTTNGLVVLLE
jgi:hypothetical protein